MFIQLFRRYKRSFPEPVETGVYLLWWCLGLAPIARLLTRLSSAWARRPVGIMLSVECNSRLYELAAEVVHLGWSSLRPRKGVLLDQLIGSAAWGLDSR